MIPWCMRAANSAGATATGRLLPQPPTQQLHTLPPNWAKLLKQKDAVCRKLAQCLTQDKSVTHQKANHLDGCTETTSNLRWSEKKWDPDVQSLCCMQRVEICDFFSFFFFCKQWGKTIRWWKSACMIEWYANHFSCCCCFCSGFESQRACTEDSLPLSD